MAIAFKPKALFPVIDQDVVEPKDWKAWEELIFRLVKHYKDRGAGIEYWEVGNEVDIGEDGGCPYRFKPDSYVRYYQHPAAAILRADPDARVGGPALANVRSPILPALVEAAAAGKTPIHFVSWHIYSSEPARVRETIEYVKTLLAKFPNVKVEKILDEWNMSLSEPRQRPQISACLCDGNRLANDRSRPRLLVLLSHPRLLRGCEEVLGIHVSARGRVHGPMVEPHAAIRRPVRLPEHCAACLLCVQTPVTAHRRAIALRVGGRERPRVLHLRSAVSDAQPAPLEISATPVRVTIEGAGVPETLLMRPELLDAAAPSYDENARLRPLTPVRVGKGALLTNVDLDAYGIAFWSFEPPPLSDSIFLDHLLVYLNSKFRAAWNRKITVLHPERLSSPISAEWTL